MNKAELQEIARWLGYFVVWHNGTQAKPGEYKRSGYALVDPYGRGNQYPMETEAEAWEHHTPDEDRLTLMALRRIVVSTRFDIHNLPDEEHFAVWRVAPDYEGALAVTHHSLAYAIAKAYSTYVHWCEVKYGDK